MKEERNWEKYKGIIFGLAFKFSPNNPNELDDLIGEGFVCFMEVVQEEKKYGLLCSFEAALSTRLKQHFLCKDKERKQLKRVGQLVDFIEMEGHPKLSKNPWEAIEDYISLPKEMREVVDIMMESPAELIDLIRKENFKVGLSKYLKEYKKWTTKEVNGFWKKIEVKERG